MKRLYYIILTVLSIFVLSWVLPWLYSLCFPAQGGDPFVGFSPVNDKFIISTPINDVNEEPEIFDLDPVTGAIGKHYNRDERDSLLPEVFVNQLVSKGTMPDSIKGEEMTMMNVRRNSWVFSAIPRNINRSIPTVYPLIESMPARFDLEDPKVALTLDGEVKIIDISTNNIDEKKTARFAKMFADRGFTFPAKDASANITTRKGYDNGYLLIDDDNALFHLKMQAGRPSMARIDVPEEKTPDHVFIMENADRALYGLVSMTDGSLYAITRDDYSLKQLPEVIFDPTKERMIIMKSLFSWVIKISDNDHINWVVLNSKNLSFKGRYEYIYPTSPTEGIAGWIFPFATTFTSGSDNFVYPRFNNISWHAIFLNLLLAIVVISVLHHRNVKCRIANFALTLLFGIFAFIPVMIIKH